MGIPRWLHQLGLPHGGLSNSTRLDIVKTLHHLFGKDLMHHDILPLVLSNRLGLLRAHCMGQDG